MTKMKAFTALAFLHLAAIGTAEPDSVVDKGSITPNAPVTADEVDAPRDAAKERTRKSAPQNSRADVVPRSSDVRARFLVARNRLVRIEFVRGALTISAEGRSLSNGSEGDVVRVLNLGSRAIVNGVVVGVDRVAVQ